MIVLQLDGSAIAIARVDGVVYAFDNTCPHRGGELGRGDLLGYLVHCPLHAWCFDVRSGVAVYPRGACMARYAAIETNGRISIQKLPEQRSDTK